MSDLNFTPGPWVVMKDPTARYESSPFMVVAIDDCDIHAIADCSQNHSCRTPDIAEANARLIAAAPDMYQALIDMIGGAESMGWNVEKARVAIAKAEGKSK